MQLLLMLPLLLTQRAESSSRPPHHLPPPAVRGPPVPPPPNHYVKAISVATCALAFGDGAAYGVTSTAVGNYVAAPSTASVLSGGRLFFYCDARLPAEAVGFDFAELEYFAPDEAGNASPLLMAYVDCEAPNAGGYAYVQTLAAGSCSGPLTPRYLGPGSISTCATDVAQAFTSAGGMLPGFWPWETWTYFSVHFLIAVPSSPDPTQPNLVYRLLVHYQAP